MEPRPHAATDPRTAEVLPSARPTTSQTTTHGVIVSGGEPSKPSTHQQLYSLTGFNDMRCGQGSVEAVLSVLSKP